MSRARVSIAACVALITVATAPAMAAETPSPLPTVSIPAPAPVPSPTPPTAPTPKPSPAKPSPSPLQKPSKPAPAPSKSSSPSPSPSPSPTPSLSQAPEDEPKAPVTVPQDSGVQPKAGARLWGVDVAAWQHPGGDPVNWTALRASSDRPGSFAFVKVSEGDDYVNDWYARDRDAAKKAGLLVGAYHYATPSRPVIDSAKSEAAFAVKAHGGKVAAGELPMVLDLETNSANLAPQELAQWALVWLAEVEHLSGRRPIVYTYPSFFREQVFPDPGFASYPLWIANYGRDLNAPNVPAPWTGWDFWQFSSAGELDGVRGAVDLNVYAGTAGQLAALAAKSAPKPPVVTVVGNPLLTAGRNLLDGLLGPVGATRRAP